jgi:TonB-dependent receptor
VTGIRASVQAAMDVKRDSAGVVDAINAEDIGKFPDTNLAESLQRITGVSISRNNGEGAEVTVRGFGAGNNMVTLNGRVMPAAQTANGDGGGSRAFDFGNLASDGVSGVEVYKTGKASITTGGIGATINLLTARPLDGDGFKGSISAKAIHDTTNRFGDDVTPEVSGLVSWANDASTFGASLSVSHSQRDSAQTGAFVNGWMISEWSDLDDPTTLWNGTNVIVNNAPEDGQLYARFEDIRYQFSDTQRTRDNAHLTLQFAPKENFTATADFIFAENENQTHLGQTGNWMQQGANLREVTFDDQAIATPIYVRESYANGIDEGFEQQWNENTSTLKSIGINLEYQATDELSFKLDVHDSEMHSRGTGPRDANGRATGQIRLALGAPIVESREWFFGGDLPTYLNQYNDAIPGRGANGNGVVDAGDVGSTMLNLRNADQLSTVTQLKLDGSYEFENGRFDFGVEAREMESHTVRYHAQDQSLGGWDASYPGEFGDLVQPFDLHGEFDDFSPRREGGYGFRANPKDMYQYIVDNIDGSLSRYSAAVPTAMPQIADNRVTEDMLAAYFQFEVGGDLGGMPYSILAGLRYETTDVKSSSLAAGYRTIWASNNDLTIQADPNQPASLVSAEASYDNLLPSLDVTLNITDDLIGRFSVSKTIARAGLSALGVSASGFGAGGGSTLLGAEPQATASNPGLLPLESTNFDVSLEWYYDDSSYVSVGAFEKNVFNFIGNEQVTRELLDIRNPTAGPRAEAAYQQLVAAGLAINDDNLFGQMVFNEHIDLGNGQLHQDWIAEFGNAQFDGSLDQVTYLNGAAGPNNGTPAHLDAWNIISNDDDPAYRFRTATPNNGREAKIYGMEFAVQHFFGNTGFGVQANYTFVRGDVAFDDLGDPNVSQFYLPGLSDTANLVGIYENDRFQGRIAYNWRDKYQSGDGRGSINPMYVEAYSQIDISLSYEVIDNLVITAEGLNVTGEDSRTHGRNKAMLFDLWDLGARYQLGARYTF